MEQIRLEGDTLGQKQRNYINLVKAFAADDAYKLSDLNYYESDLHNMLRIDVACSRREVEYILEVLEYQDMMYVSRAIKGSIWLVTEEQYSHIINPEYLNKELFPNMMTKAKKKLLASIRKNLKDATRVEAFFNYYKDNFLVAQCWLRHCSIDFIQDVVMKYADEISSNVIKHLCRKSSKILKCYLNSHSRDSHLLHRYLLQAESEEAIQILDLIYSANQRKPNFGKRFTRSLMKLYSDDIIDNFQRYYYGIHMPTFVKYLDKEDIEKILLLDIDNDFMKQFYKYDNLKHYLRCIPEINRVKLIKTILSETEDNPPLKSATNFADLRVALGYRCYEFVPFDCAFLELKNTIITESSPYKRMTIFGALINSARGNSQHIQTLLEYYRTHLNTESVENKVQFLNKLIDPSIMRRLNPHVWLILEDIFISMDLNAYTCEDVPKCLKTMIIYKLIHDEHTPEAFKSKVNCKSFLDFRPYLSVGEQRTVLNYVYDTCFAKTLKKDIENEEEMRVMVDTIKNVLVLLRDWNKGPDEYPWVTNKIREIIKIKTNNDWNIDLSELYHIHRLFRKELFDVSLVLCLSDETCLNVLKHDTNLLLREMDALVDKCSNRSVSLKQTLGKLRVYWPKATVKQWIDSYLKRLHQPVGQKTIVESICILLSHKEAMSSLIKKYAPGDTKSAHEESGIVLRQNIIKCWHLLRPSVDNKALFLYAKPGYLRYLLPSLNVILRNQSSNEFWKSIFSFVTYDPLCKYSARLALSMLKKNNLDDYYKKKLPLIKKIRDLLNKQENVASASAIWDLLIKVYGDLLPDERQKVRINMYTIYEVAAPIKVISFVKLYEIYKIDGVKHESASEAVIYIADELFDNLEPAFIKNELIPIATQHIITDIGFYSSINVLSKYILKCDSEKEQVVRYEQILTPIMDHCFASLRAQRCISHFCHPTCSKHKIYKILDYLSLNLFPSITKYKCTVPVQLCTHIKNKLETELHIEEELNIIVNWNFIVLFLVKLRDHIKLLGKVFIDKDPDLEWNKFSLDIVNSVAKAWLLYYKPILLESGSFHVFVSRACLNVFSFLCLSNDFKLSFVKWLLSENDDPLLYCIAIDILRHVYIDHGGNSSENLSSDAVIIKKELIDMISFYPAAEVQTYYNHYSSNLML